VWGDLSTNSLMEPLNNVYSENNVNNVYKEANQCANILVKVGAQHFPAFCFVC
jgi:predicted kinase